MDHDEAKENSNDDVYPKLMIDFLGVDLKNVEFQVTTTNMDRACFSFLRTIFVSRLHATTTTEMDDDEKEMQLNWDQMSEYINCTWWTPHSSLTKHHLYQHYKSEVSSCP